MRPHVGAASEAAHSRLPLRQLVLELDANPTLSEFLGLDVDFKDTESIAPLVVVICGIRRKNFGGRLDITVVLAGS